MSEFESVLLQTQYARGAKTQPDLRRGDRLLVVEYGTLPLFLFRVPAIRGDESLVLR